MSERRNGNPVTWPRRLLRRLRQWLAATAAVLIIATAVIVGIGRLLIPYADELRPWFEARLSDRLGQPVSIEQVEARWPRLTPQITLDGLRAGESDSPLLALDEARLELHLPDLFRGDRNPFRLVVLGLDLELAEDESGQWGLRLADGGQLALATADGESLAGDLVVRDVAVRISPRQGPRLDLVISEGEIRRRGETTGLVARAHPAAVPDAALSLALRGRHGGGRLESVTGRVNLRRLRLEAPGLDRLLPAFLSVPPDRLDATAEFDWQRNGGGALDLDVELTGAEGFDAAASLRVERDGSRIDAELLSLQNEGRTVVEGLVLAREGDLWAAQLPSLALGEIHRLAGRWLGDGARWPRDLSGRITDLSVLVDSTGSLHRLDGRVDGFTLNLPGDRLRLAGLDFDLGLSGDRAALALGGSPVVDWPAKMRGPVSIETISGRVIVSPRAVELDEVVGERPEFRARANGWVWLGGGRPFLDFTVIAERIGSVDPRPWLPAGQIPPRTLAWLDRALLGVEGATGGLNYHFRLGHKFRQWGAGDFQAWADFRGLDLDFWQGWPVARGLSGRVDFVGRAMTGRIDRGRLRRLELAAERITVEDLKQPELSIALRTDGEATGQALRDLLASLPFEGWSRYVAPVSASGEVAVETELFLPFRSMEAWRLSGRVDLSGTSLGVPAARLRFPGLHGRVAFDRQGIEPSALSLAAGSEPVVSLSARFGAPARLSIDSRLPPADLLPPEAPFSALARRLDGAAEWGAVLAGHEDGGWRLALQSDLQGLALNLPEPLAKPREAPLPLDLSLRSHESVLTLTTRLGDRLNLMAESEAGRLRLAAGLGRAAPALPSAAGFEVAGQVDRLDLQAWSEWLAESSAQPADGGRQGRIRLRLGQLDYGNLSLKDVELDARREAAEWHVDLAGPSVSGQVTIPLPIDSGRVVAVDLTRLDLVHSLDPGPSEDLAEAPVPAQTRTHVPTAFPPLHLLVESLHYDELALGRVRMESHARRDGIEIERVEVAGPFLELSGYGRWILTDDGPVTLFDGRLISTDLPALLSRLGQGSQFEAARAQIEVNGRWPGAPFDFSLARLDGSMQLLMTDGSIPQASPGAGRLLGLASLSAMPRRLMLDFRDVFGEGLKFDRIEGRFELAGGVARTDGLRLASPAADITVTGETDLGARRYDQTIVVEPGVGGTLPVLGGLAGGPAGAAAGLILRSLLERPLQGIAEARYRVTGSWDDPHVELIDARAAEPEPQNEPENGEQAPAPEPSPNEPASTPH